MSDPLRLVEKPLEGTNHITARQKVVRENEIMILESVYLGKCHRLGMIQHPNSEKQNKTSMSRNQFSRQLGGDCGVGAECVGLGRETLHAGMLGVVAGLLFCVAHGLVQAVTLARDISNDWQRWMRQKLTLQSW